MVSPISSVTKLFHYVFDTIRNFSVTQFFHIRTLCRTNFILTYFFHYEHFILTCYITTNFILTHVFHCERFSFTYFIPRNFFLAFFHSLNFSQRNIQTPNVARRLVLRTLSAPPPFSHLERGAPSISAVCATSGGSRPSKTHDVAALLWRYVYLYHRRCSHVLSMPPRSRVIDYA